MVRQEIYIRKYDWRVTVFYAVTRYHTEDIMDELYNINCDGKHAKSAYENLRLGRINTGLTYSNYLLRSTVMVIAMASSGGEFVNSLAHEVHHLAVHISKVYGIDLYGEEVCYLSGNVMQ